MAMNATQIRDRLANWLVELEALEQDQCARGNRGWCPDLDVAWAALERAEGYYALRASHEMQAVAAALGVK